MDKFITKRITKKGIEVNILIKGEKFDVYIDITPEVDVARKIKYEEFNLTVILTNKEKKLKEAIHLEKKDLKYDNNSANVNLRLKFDSEECKCIISLAPKLYVPNEVIKKTKQKQKKVHKAKNKIRFNDRYRPGMSVSRGIKYSKTNIARPYSGGRCSPK